MFFVSEVTDPELGQRSSHQIGHEIGIRIYVGKPSGNSHNRAWPILELERVHIAVIPKCSRLVRLSLPGHLNRVVKLSRERSYFTDLPLNGIPDVPICYLL